MKIVLLDGATLNDDVSLKPLEELEGFIYYSGTQEDEKLNRIKNADIIITNKIEITEKDMDNAPKLKMISVLATGINNVDLSAAEKKNIFVANAVGYSTNSVAQHVFALILSLCSHFFPYRKLIDKNMWQKTSSFCLLDYPIVELTGKTLGIIGYGMIGRRVEEIAKTFGMNIVIAKSIKSNNQSNDRIPLKELLKISDVVTIHVPLAELTKNLITKNELECMKKSAILINCARGGIVNEYDLVQALVNEKIAGAGVDVLSVEPPVEGNLLLDAVIPNLIITPHIAWSSKNAREELINITVGNIKKFLSRKIDSFFYFNSG